MSPHSCKNNNNTNNMDDFNDLTSEFDGHEVSIESVSFMNNNNNSINNKDLPTTTTTTSTTTSMMINDDTSEYVAVNVSDLNDDEINPTTTTTTTTTTTNNNNNNHNHNNDTATTIETAATGNATRSNNGVGSSDPHDNKSSSTTTTCTVVTTVVDSIKYICSSVLIVFCLVMLTAAMYTKQTKGTSLKYNIPPTIAFVLFWIMMIWLAQLEGGLNCNVGLKPINPNCYKNTHPRTYLCTVQSLKGDNLERFIVGRQYMDLATVFTTSLLVTATDNVQVLGLPIWVNRVFLSSGLALTLCTIVFGQLISMINSTRYMLSFMNNYLMVLSTYMALAVEASGISHSVYLIQMIVAALSGQKLQSSEPPRSPVRQFLFWIRILFSVSLLLFAIVTVLIALLNGNTTVWDSVPVYVSFIAIIIIIIIGGLMESLQIATMYFTNRSSTLLDNYPVAKRNYEIIFDGTNLQSFLIGRQILQTAIILVFARIVTIDMHSSSTNDGENHNIYGVSDGIQKAFNTGALGVVMAVVLTSLSWRILGANFPIMFLNCPLSRPIIALCCLTEKSGICHIAWQLSRVHAALGRFQCDDEILIPQQQQQQQQQDNRTNGKNDNSTSTASSIDGKQLEEEEEQKATVPASSSSSSTHYHHETNESFAVNGVCTH